MLSDLRESGALEQDADIVSFLYREDYYDKETENQHITEVILAKHRNGPVGSVKLYFKNEFTLFLNLDTQHEGSRAAFFSSHKESEKNKKSACIIQGGVVY